MGKRERLCKRVQESALAGQAMAVGGEHISAQFVPRKRPIIFNFQPALAKQIVQKAHFLCPVLSGLCVCVQLDIAWRDATILFRFQSLPGMGQNPCGAPRPTPNGVNLSASCTRYPHPTQNHTHTRACVLKVVARRPSTRGHEIEMTFAVCGCKFKSFKQRRTVFGAEVVMDFSLPIHSCTRAGVLVPRSARIIETVSRN